MADRLDALLQELAEQVTRARAHEGVMRQAVSEAAGWSRIEDQMWVAGAFAESHATRIDAERRLEQGRAIAARARQAVAS